MLQPGGINDPALEAIKTSLAASQGNCIFDDVVETCKTFISQQNLHKRPRTKQLNISALSQMSGNLQKD